MIDGASNRPGDSDQTASAQEIWQGGFPKVYLTHQIHPMIPLVRVHKYLQVILAENNAPTFIIGCFVGSLSFRLTGAKDRKGLGKTTKNEKAL